MNTLDAHGVLKAYLLRSGRNAKKSGKSIAFRCPRHNDSTASAWLGEHAWGCSACGFTEGLVSLATELGVDLPKQDGASGLTMVEYAERKGLALDTLTKAQVYDLTGKYGQPVVAIPYFDPQGNLIRTKCRTRKGTFWQPDGVGTPLYGQWMLSALNGPVLLVEGESDCHAAWQRGVCAVGLPGASMWKPEFAALLQGREVVVWQEPDEGGATMVAKVSSSLPTARVLSNVTHRGGAIKDLCDLHQSVQSHGDDWTQTWRTVLDTATPIGASAPVVVFDSVSGDTLNHLLEEKLKPIDSVPTMLDTWNVLCGGGGGGRGLARGWIVTIGANTGTGKTLLGLNLAQAAANAGETASFLSLEMGRSELATRLMAIASGESVACLDQGPSFSTESFRRAQQTMDTLKQRTGGEVLMNRRPLSKLTDVMASIRYNVETLGSRFFVVDYLQLVWTANAHSIAERTEIVAHQLREAAQQYNVVMVLLSQFNRETSRNRAERPTAQGLMGGSALENDSHQVLLFDHSRFVRTANLADTWLIVDKNRHGAITDLPVQWDYRTLRLSTRIPSITESEEKHGRLLPKWKERH
jgi:KaiC/GvpD/RAD55 family RecA-like ATPase